MIEHPLGVVVAVGSILVFHGSVYVLVALNMGWRFGYWVTGASLFALMFIMSIFWLVTALGPRGAEPIWLVVGADQQPVAQATIEEQTLTRYSTYPSGWESADDEQDPLFEEVDAIRSAVGNCLDTEPERLPESEREVCTTAQGFKPELPIREGQEILATNEVLEVRFTEDNGVRIAQTRVEPRTRDPRYTDNDEEGELLSEPFHIALYRDPGSLRTPALKYLVASTLLLLFHLWGLARAERKVLSPIVAL